MSILYISDEIVHNLDSAWLENLKSNGHVILIDNTNEHHSIAARQAWADFAINLANLVILPLDKIDKLSQIVAYQYQKAQESDKPIWAVPKAAKATLSHIVKHLNLDEKQIILGEQPSQELIDYIVQQPALHQQTIMESLQAHIPQVDMDLPLSNDTQWTLWILQNAIQVLLPYIQIADLPLENMMDIFTALISNPSALLPYEAFDCAHYLGQLGDKRHGVGVEKGFPDIDWVEIPAGRFIVGLPMSDEAAKKLPHDNPEYPGAEYELPTYSISRYPITIAQFRAFLEDTGQDKRLQKAPFSLPGNYPMTDVTWYEAVEFCNWLSSKLRYPVRLPTEAEWQKAAAGAESLRYPYGNEFDPQKGNSRESGIGSLTPVGIFPEGASPYGVLDMSGNIWEWTLTKWRRRDLRGGFQQLPSYHEMEDNGIEGTAQRIICGGAYTTTERLCRTNSHYMRSPEFPISIQGFRIVHA
jgi:formylglycine-generating enzyme required for sulfatase activity